MLTEQEKQEQLWALAAKRASFKKHLYTYVFTNLFLIGVWYFTSNGTEDYYERFWPKWVILGWGIGLAMNYVKAYHSNDSRSIEKEYEKLKNN